MLNKDYLSGILNANRQSMGLDFSPIPNKWDKLPQVVSQGISDWDKAKKYTAYIDALQSGDENAINEAAAAYNPEAYANYMQNKAQREQDRQWQLEDIAEQRAFQEKMQQQAFNNQWGLAKYRERMAQNAIDEENARLQNALDSGLISQEEYNQKRRSQILGDIARGGQPGVNDNPFDKKRIEKAASEMDANIARAQEMKATFEQANNALKNINTGTPLAMFSKNKPFFSNADEEAFDSAAAKSIDMVRKAGTGPMTDADARRYEKATIDRSKDKATNQLLIDTGLIAADNAMAKENLRADWVSNGGSISAFDREWDNYLRNNPIFDPNSKQNRVNQNRVSAMDWFYGNRQPTTQVNQNYGNMSDEDLLKGL